MLFNSVHSRLEKRLERVLFRRLYVLEESLRRLGERVESITDEVELFEEVARSLQEALALASCEIYRESDGRFALVASAGRSAASANVPVTSFTLPLGVGGKSYGGIVVTEDPHVEALASEELELLRSLAQRLSAAIAALRAEKYEQLLKAMS